MINFYNVYYNIYVIKIILDTVRKCKINIINTDYKFIITLNFAFLFLQLKNIIILN